MGLLVSGSWIPHLFRGSKLRSYLIAHCWLGAALGRVLAQELNKPSIRGELEYSVAKIGYLAAINPDPASPHSGRKVSTFTKSSANVSVEYSPAGWLDFPVPVRSIENLFGFGQSFSRLAPRPLLFSCASVVSA